MGFMDGMISQITQAGQSTVQKAKDISDVARLNNAISETENRIIGLYERIGYNVYCAYKNNPLPEVAEQIQQVTDLHQQIENCKAQIKVINAASLCPNCGAKIKSGAAFCSECGCKLSVQEASSASGQVTYCSDCGSPIEAGAAFCMTCGKRLDAGRCVEAEQPVAKATEFCHNCGSPLAADTDFCLECGKKIER